jgi:hypothetical protein
MNNRKHFEVLDGNKVLADFNNKKDAINFIYERNLKYPKAKLNIIEKYAKGGGIEKENAEMVLNNNKQISHHTKELASAVKGKKVPAWVVAKVNRSASDLSDATHYLDGSKYGKGGTMKGFCYTIGGL